ncbi:RNA polymerase III subunit RPC82-domain-containing protein [Mucidula mucida]|nr:RNA polymerase III subunit RPC82-domain-containing protein [Mucidula mucida]
MADSHTSRLCVQIITSHFGALTAKVASVLLTRGRLTLPYLVRYSGLKPRTVRAAVLVLVQHNLLWHATIDREGEVLEVNVDECLMRLRFAKYVWVAENLFGDSGRDIVQLILDHGKLRSRDIHELLPTVDLKVYSRTLYKLVEASYLKPSTILSHESPRDKIIKYEAEEKAKIAGFPTSKQLREAKETAEAKLKREEEAAESVGRKRKAKDQSSHRPSKRRNVDDDGDVDDTVYFRINFDKFNIHLRNSLIERAVRERYNEGAALVVKAALKVTESSQRNLLDVRTEPISVSNIALQLSEDDDLSTGLAYSSKKKISNTTCIKEYLGILSSADNPTPESRAAAFLTFDSQKVHIEFELIFKRLRRSVLEAVTRERHGTQGVRIVRLLLQTGKMEEKQIAKVAMMAAKDVRPLLSALATDSIISTSEVPKTSERNPLRTIYLWYVDLAKAYSVILGQLYKTLHNISSRRQTEREAPLVRAVLQKRERTDVKMDESLLSSLDRDIIDAWEQKEERLTVLEMRVEESVFVLRDMGVFGIDDD